MNEELVVPVDDGALALLETALEYHFTSELDENGDPIPSGEFSLYQLLEFWSGYDPALSVEEVPGVYVYRGGPVLHSTDVIRALIQEIRRLRNG